MKIPAFIFTCNSCRGETVIDFHRINFSHTYMCSECSRPFKITKRQGLSISKQLEDYANSLPDEELAMQ
jgi:DNA replicative helicase MCM subunit Mcm2 (Cdc46/Mcm family)